MVPCCIVVVEVGSYSIQSRVLQTPTLQNTVSRSVEGRLAARKVIPNTTLARTRYITIDDGDDDDDDDVC